MNKSVGLVYLANLVKTWFQRTERGHSDPRHDGGGWKPPAPFASLVVLLLLLLVLVLVLVLDLSKILRFSHAKTRSWSGLNCKVLARRHGGEVSKESSDSRGPTQSIPSILSIRSILSSGKI